MSDKNTRVKEERRREIIKAAAELFAEKGFEATTVSEIVQRVGMAQGTFYLYFPSKEHVRLALREQIADDIIEASIKSYEQEKDIVKRIEYGLKASFQVLKKYEKLIVLAHLGSSVKECEIADREMSKKLAAPMIELLKEGMSGGVVRENDPAIIAHIIIGMCERAAINALLWEEPAALEEVIPVVIEFIKKAIII